MARGSIRKLDGGWGFRIDLGPDPATGKRRQVSKQGFTTKRDAEAALRELSQSVDTGTLAMRSMRTLGDYLDEWHDLQEDRLRATTWHSYAIAIDRIKRRLGQSKLQALEPLALERFYAYLLAEGGRFGKGLSPKTVRNTHTVLRKALSDAERLGLVGRNAAASARAPSDDRTEYQTWSSDELRTFLDVARDDRLYAAFVLLMTTGMRRGEVLGLRWFDVDFDDNSLSVANTSTTTAKGHRVSGPPKTLKSRRQVYLDPATVDALRSHRARQNEERLAAGPAWDTDCKYVFTDELGDRFDPETFSNLFRRYAAQDNHPSTDAKRSELTPLHERVGGRPPDAEDHRNFRNGVRPPANRSQPTWRRQSGPPARPRVWAGDEGEVTSGVVRPKFHTVVWVTESAVE